MLVATRTYFAGLADVLNQIDTGAVDRLVAWIQRTRRSGGTVYMLGNGGSASTASHLAVDLAKNTRRPDRPNLRTVSLTENPAVLTAWANDTYYEEVFAAQLDGVVRPGDLVVAISASGNSPNVLAAVRVAEAAGAVTFALTGFARRQGLRTWPTTAWSCRARACRSSRTPTWRSCTRSWSRCATGSASPAAGEAGPTLSHSVVTADYHIRDDHDIGSGLICDLPRPGLSTRPRPLSRPDGPPMSPLAELRQEPLAIMQARRRHLAALRQLGSHATRQTIAEALRTAAELKSPGSRPGGPAAPLPTIGPAVAVDGRAELTRLLDRVRVLLELDGLTLLLPTADGQLAGLHAPVEAETARPARRGARARSSVIGIPLLADDAVIGVLQTEVRYPRRFTWRIVRLVEMATECLTMAVRRSHRLRGGRVGRGRAHPGPGRRGDPRARGRPDGADAGRRRGRDPAAGGRHPQGGRGRPRRPGRRGAAPRRPSGLDRLAEHGRRDRSVAAADRGLGRGPGRARPTTRRAWRPCTRST